MQSSMRVLDLSQNKLETLCGIESELSSNKSDGDGTNSEDVGKLKRSLSSSAALCTKMVGAAGWQLPTLEEIYLQDNQLEFVPESIFELPNVQLMDLSNNKLRSLSYKIWFSPKLRELNLSLNLLCDLPLPPHSSTSSSPLKSLTDKKSKSSFSSQDEAEPCEDDSKFKQHEVKHINLWAHSIEVVTRTVEEESEKTSKITSLNLSHNGFTRIPHALSCLASNLTHLNMSYNCLTSLGYIQSYPVNLKHIDLSQNQISSWLTSIMSENDPSLEALICSIQSHLDLNQSIPKVTSPLPKAKNKCATCVHKQHTRLDNLKTLILANNKMSTIDLLDEESYEQDIDIESLDQIEKSRSSRFYFPNISIMDVSHNVIKEIPIEISDLSNLSVFNVSDNRDITFLPPEMGLLNKLWNLNTRGCNLTEPLKSMIESKNYKTMDIIGYLRSILEE